MAKHRNIEGLTIKELMVYLKCGKNSVSKNLFYQNLLQNHYQNLINNFESEYIVAKCFNLGKGSGSFDIVYINPQICRPNINIHKR